MRIYMDVCCLNRPFDDLTQHRVQFESDAVLTILSHCVSGEWELVLSEVINMEFQKQTNSEKLKKVMILCSCAKEQLIGSEQATERAKVFQQYGMKVFDSLHLAVAETCGVDVFLTTDDGLIRAARRVALSITVANPITWLMEVLRNEEKYSDRL